MNAYIAKMGRPISHRNTTKNKTYFGFKSANNSGEPAWFHTTEAAQRFAKSCGWENAEIETATSDEVFIGDVMDTATCPWTI